MQGPGVGRHVDDLRLSTGLEERVPHRRNQRDHQEGSGAGSDQAVVEPDHGADGACHHVVCAAAVPEFGEVSGVGPKCGEQRDGHQGHHDDRLEHLRRQPARPARP